MYYSVFLIRKITISTFLWNLPISTYFPLIQEIWKCLRCYFNEMFYDNVKNRIFKCFNKCKAVKQIRNHCINFNIKIKNNNQNWVTRITYSVNQVKSMTKREKRNQNSIREHSICAYKLESNVNKENESQAWKTHMKKNEKEWVMAVSNIFLLRFFFCFISIHVTQNNSDENIELAFVRQRKSKR